MIINTKILLFQILLFFSFASENVFAINQDSKNSTTEQEVIDHLIRAETWYWMSRVTFNSLEYHRYAEKEYLKAKEKAALLSSPLKENYTNTAEAGFEQTYWRKINAWNSFRNIFPAAWWYSGADSTLDYQDEDHLMLALSGAWAGLEAGLSKQLTPKIFVVPRCNDSEKFEQSTDCGEIKDEFLNMMDVNARFLGIRDDAVATSIGPEWEEFLKGQKPRPEHIKALGDFHQVENIVVVDIYAVDEFEDPIVAGRIDIQFNQWDVNTMRLMSAGNESGVVVSLRDRRWMAPSWLIFLLLLSFLFTYIQLKINKDDNKLFTQYLIPNLIFFLTGYLLSYFSGMVSDQFIPDWGAMALNTDHYLPLTEMWLWTFVHGAVIMVGPIILCAYFLLQFGQRIPGIGGVLDKNDFQNTSTILFSVQAGALGALFSPIIMAWHNEGIILALGLSAAAFLLSVSVARPFSSVVGADSEENSSLTLFIGILGLILIIPIGFFRPEWAGYWPIIITIAQAIAISLIIHKLNGNISESLTQKEPKTSNKGDKDGSLDYPKWVNRENVIIKEKVNSLINEATKGSVKTLIIGTKDGIGKTRLMEEIYQELNKQKNDPPWKLVWSKAEQPNENHIEEPYSLISKAFGDAIGISNLADKQSKQEKFREVLSGVEGTLADLPMGIGALFDFADEDHEVASKDQITRDMIEAVKKQIDDYPLAFFLDDIQWADKESLDLLAKMIKDLSQKQHNNSLVFVLGDRDEKTIQHYFNNPSTLSAEIIKLEVFNSVKTAELITGAGLDSPKWLGEKLVEHMGEPTPKLIIEALHLLTIKGSDDSTELPDELNNLDKDEDKNLINEKIESSVPKEVKDILRIRLNELHDEDRIILEAAAEIGRSFSVTLLAAGLEEERLTLLRSLKRIEDDFHLIIDDQTTDDIMSLESQSLRSVLRENSIYTNFQNKRELYKEMHFKIAQKMIENEKNFNPLEIMKHCILSGIRLHKESIDFGIKSIISAANKDSWSTVDSITENWLKETNDQRIVTKDDVVLTQEQKHKLKFYKAKALHSIGKKTKMASDILESLFNSKYISKYQLFYTYLKNKYDQRKFEDIIVAIDNIEKDGYFGSEEIVLCLGEFYKNISLDKLQELENTKLINSLDALCSKIELISSVIEKDKSQLLSMIFQEIGIKLAFADDVDGDPLNAFNKSLELKEKIKDLEGLAINYGVRSGYYSKINDLSNAMIYRIKSLLIEEKRGNEPGQSQSLNKLAELYYNYNKDSNSDTNELAFNFALSAFKIAANNPHEMKDNYIFSAINVFKYGKEFGKIISDFEIPEIDYQAKRDLVGSNNEIEIDGKPLNIISSIKKMEATLETWDWLSNAKKLSEPTDDTETAS